jgi:undecaprenyl-diphosphatase
MSLLQIIILALVQGLAELLPVSSSAHVVVAEKLMGLDPSSPSMTFLLVMLHTGTMLAVIVYFWRQWRASYFQSMAAFKEVVVNIVLATLNTLNIAVLAPTPSAKMPMTTAAKPGRLMSARPETRMSCKILCT